MRSKLSHENLAGFFASYGEILRILQKNRGSSGWLAGGCVRDLLLGEDVKDLDITVPDQPDVRAKELLRGLGRGSLVQLGDGDDTLFRVMIDGRQVDFVSFRGGAKGIEEDLVARDLTINSLAVDVDALVTGGEYKVIDVTGGCADIASGVIRHCPGAFAADPLRMLRAYRFMTILGFRLAGDTESEIRRYGARIEECAGERISAELHLVMAARNAERGIHGIAHSGLLAYILPELLKGSGVTQPDFHHLDVFEHCLFALKQIDNIAAKPNTYFNCGAEELSKYLEVEQNLLALKWAALLHDIAKPITRSVHKRELGRVTFHRHDEQGSRLCLQIGRRLRWSGQLREQVARLVEMHMHPFHLCNVQRDEGEISSRAALKLFRRADQHLPGLFMLSMADSLASQGRLKPVEMERELDELFCRVLEIRDTKVRPALAGQRLLTGRDLVDVCGLKPGPLFSTILDELEIARVEGEVQDREGALVWVYGFLKKIESDGRKVRPEAG